MGSSREFADFVADQVRAYGAVRIKPMFGEFFIYINSRPIVLICDDITYLKCHPEIAEAMDGVATGVPFEGANPWYMVDIEDRLLLDEVIPQVIDLTPIPQAKRRPTHQPGTDFPWAVGKPAARALTAAGISSLDEVMRRRPEELLELHGVGPKAIGVLADALRARGDHWGE